MISMNTEKIESDNQLPEWAFVEVMGHSKICGRLSAVKLGVAVMLQIQVQKADGTGPAYSKMYSPASLFSITPVNRDYCLLWSKQAEAHELTPVPWLPPAVPQLTSGDDRESDDFFEWCAAHGYQDVADEKW